MPNEKKVSKIRFMRLFINLRNYCGLVLCFFFALDLERHMEMIPETQNAG